MISYWEQKSFVSYDLIIVGAGITGLSTALELKKLYPGKRILITERGIFPSGASTRNAGFACMGSLTELLNDLETMTKEEVIALFERRKTGLELLRARLGDHAMGYAENGSYELITEAELPALEKMDLINDLLYPITGKKAFKECNERIGSFGFNRQIIQGMIENTCEGELDTGKMMRALTDMVLGSGIEIKTGTEIISWEEERGQVLIKAKNPVSESAVTLKCNQLFICTNAFTKALLPEVYVVPGRGQVLITEPIKELTFKGIFHFDKGYYYFRVIDGSILIGGGRNLDFDGETTTLLELNEQIQQDIEHKLQTLIVPGKKIAIAMRWSGIMAFGDSKQPIIQQFGSNVFGGFRMGGMGIALASQVALDLALLSTR